jgi:hypothetical protein
LYHKVIGKTRRAGATKVRRHFPKTFCNNVVARAAESSQVFFSSFSNFRNIPRVVPTVINSSRPVGCRPLMVKQSGWRVSLRKMTPDLIFWAHST